jgi:hypothetical protein
MQGSCKFTLGKLQGQYSDFTVYLTYKDDDQKTLKNAALADLNSRGAATSQIQYFVRRVVVGAMNRMVSKKNNNPSTFTDCNAGATTAADNLAKASAVQLFYDDAAKMLKMQFRVAIPMYWVAATVVNECDGPPPARHPSLSSVDSLTHQADPNAIMTAMSTNVFYCGTNTGAYCDNTSNFNEFGTWTGHNTQCKNALKGDLDSRQAIIDEAAQLRGMSGTVVSQLVKALNPNTYAKRDVVSYLRGLLLKSGKPAKIVGGGTVGDAAIKKGP